MVGHSPQAVRPGRGQGVSPSRRWGKKRSPRDLRRENPCCGFRLREEVLTCQGGSGGTSNPSPHLQP